MKESDHQLNECNSRKNGDPMTWHLKFRDHDIEESFQEERQLYQYEISPFCNLFLIFSSILMWAIGKEPINLRQIIFNTVKIPMIVAFLYARKRFPKHIEMIIIVLMLPFIIVVVENTKFSVASSNIFLNFYLFGTYHDNFCIFWLLLRISWKKTLILLVIITCFIAFRFFDIDTNIQYKMSPFQICIGNFILYSLFAYVIEKNERLRFFTGKQKENSLIFFQKFIEESLALGVIVIRQNDILFNNSECKKLLGIEGREFIIDDIKNLEIEEEERNSEPENYGENRTDANSFNNVLVNFSRGQRKKSNHYFGKKKNFENENKSQKLILRISKIIWKEEFATIITLTEDLNSIKLEYMKEFELFKDRVLASVSHQFRTPLNGVMGILESVSDFVHDKFVKESLDLAMASSQRLLSVINDILDFSQINLGRFTLNLSQFSTDKLLKEVYLIYEQEALKKGIDFKIENLTEHHRISAREWIFNDKERLKQVLCNMLSNSFRFTSQGFVRVTYEYDYRENQKPKIRFTVEDSGCGIKENMIERLFEYFGKIRENNFKALNTDGLGFGLAISQKLLCVMNKNERDFPIKVCSTPGKGSSFSFEIVSLEDSHRSPYGSSESHEIPMIKINEMTEEDQPVESITKYDFPIIKSSRVDTSINLITNIKRRKKRILAVDDDPLNIMVVTRHLNNYPNIEYATASNGLEALNLIENEAKLGSNFDLVLMDCNMPVMDGYEATEKIKTLAFNNVVRDIPIIAVTANVLPSDLQRCLDCGMADFLTKPFSRATLFEKISRYL